MRLLNALVQRVILPEREVGRLTVLDKLLSLCLLILFFLVVDLAKSEHLHLLLFPFEHFSDQSLDILRFNLFLHLGPNLHNGVLELHLEGVRPDGHIELRRRLGVVVEDVVKGDGVRGRHQVLLDVLPGTLHVSATCHH